uniref:Elongation of very long chain fatty acids protein n=1 Tax=Oryzias latipes TaxID=8090 RepID=A0A3P9LSP9_ORYLA
MAAVWNNVVSLHQTIVENGDKRTDPWLLVYSPVQVFLIFLVYLGVVWAGPRLMKSREPVDLRVVLMVYNFAMVGLSAYMFYEFLVTSWLSDYSLLCQPVDYSTRPLPMRLFFILRKKNNQVTFLHVYHHGTMIFNWWAGVKYVAGGQSFFIGLVNTFVHIIMYSYYGLAAIGPHMQKYLWWKRYLTSLQLVSLPTSARSACMQTPGESELFPCTPAAAVPALPPAHRLQPVHPLRLPRLHERRGLRLLRDPHHPLQQLLLSELRQQEEEGVRTKLTGSKRTTCSVFCVR